MKKVLTTILAFVYLSTSMGATIHLHYCMGKLVSWGFISHDSKSCGICGMPKKADNRHCISVKMGCCKDEVKQVKTGDDQKIVSSDWQFLRLFSPAVTVNLLSLPDFRVPSPAITSPTSNAPPDTGKPAIFLLNRDFRI